MGWIVNATPRSLFTPGKDPLPIAQEAGWAQGLVWTGAENLAPAGIRSPDRPARSESLYRLSYPGPLPLCNNIPLANACILSTPLKLGGPGFVFTSALGVNSHNISVRVVCTHTSSVFGGSGEKVLCCLLVHWEKLSCVHA